jgi:uncharacterized protein (DUF849 family)
VVKAADIIKQMGGSIVNADEARAMLNLPKK